MAPKRTTRPQRPNAAIPPGCALPATAAEIASSRQGDSVDVTLLVTERPSSTRLVGTVLDRGPDGAYERTSHEMQVRLSTSTIVVMGRRGAIVPGVPIHVSGRIATDNADLAYADQLAVLTGLIYVKPGGA